MNINNIKDNMSDKVWGLIILNVMFQLRMNRREACIYLANRR
ncbi:hypothetical protein VMF7928_00495 [Vibrio marisflavi CECT 7928]|uniref:Uncharacterized protein n=1 Tax=Vibrio marisflavi CECT 7928 TaxID=634439 RepID=A0ABN8DZR8_9VIBR|nr:hypothetical protein VMF7928_00495 [Vibrio marisflavi CECT 7928]